MLRRALSTATRGALTGAARFKYDAAVLKQFHQPAGVGKLDTKSLNVGTGVHGSPACGDMARIQIEFDDKVGLISNAVFKTFGCGSAIAASSYACSVLVGKSLNQVLEVRNTQIASALKLPPVKKHCSLLTEGCIRKAVVDLLKKRPELQEHVDQEHIESLKLNEQ